MTPNSIVDIAIDVNPSLWIVIPADWKAKLDNAMQEIKIENARGSGEDGKTESRKVGKTGSREDNNVLLIWTSSFSPFPLRDENSVHGISYGSAHREKWGKEGKSWLLLLWV